MPKSTSESQAQIILWLVCDNFNSTVRFSLFKLVKFSFLFFSYLLLVFLSLHWIKIIKLPSYLRPRSPQGAIHTKWNLDLCSHLAATDMDRKLGGCSPVGEGELGPLLAQCGHGRGLPACQVSSWSVKPFGHNTPTSQTDRQRSDSIGRTVLQTVAQKLKPGLLASYDIRPGNGEGLVLFRRFINLSLTYLETYPLTYSPGTHMGQVVLTVIIYLHF